MKVPRRVLCGELSGLGADGIRISPSDRTAQVDFSLSGFDAVAGETLAPRWRDLLQIAAYLYATDGCVRRGSKRALDVAGQSWPRDIELVVPVEDLDFWKRHETGRALGKCIRFLMGDRVRFDFRAANEAATGQLGLFGRPDSPGTRLRPVRRVLTFSGGLDSASRLVNLLKAGEKRVAIVSHRGGGRHGKERAAVLDWVQERYGHGAVSVLEYSCVKRDADNDRSMRSRGFLYHCFAAATAFGLGVDGYEVPENGVVAVNLALRGDSPGAAVSRNAHPLFFGLMGRLLSLVAERELRGKNPWANHTRQEVVEQLVADGGEELIPRTVSCSTTFVSRRAASLPAAASHCGRCSQCVDRRFALVGAGLGQADVAAYGFDPFDGRDDPSEDAQVLVDYVERAAALAKAGDGQEMIERFGALGQVVRGDAIPQGSSEDEELESMGRLLCRHAEQTLSVCGTVIGKQAVDGIVGPPPRPDSLFMLVGKRLVDSLTNRGGDSGQASLAPLALHACYAVLCEWHGLKWDRTAQSRTEAQRLLRDGPADGTSLVDATGGQLRCWSDGEWVETTGRRGLGLHLSARIHAGQYVPAAEVARFLRRDSTAETVEAEQGRLKAALNKLMSGLGDALVHRGEPGARVCAFEPDESLLVLAQVPPKMA